MVHVTTTLKLHALGLGRLQDPNWTGMDLFDHVKQHVRGRVKPLGLLRKPLERGLLYLLGGWLYNEYFSSSRLESMEPEYQAWALEDFVEFLEHHELPAVSDPLLTEVTSQLELVGETFERGEGEYFNLLEELCNDSFFVDRFDALLEQQMASVTKLRSEYAEDYSNRVLHDRQLCAYISQLIITIGFNGDDDDTGMPRAWVQREAWPERVKTILRSRDRGACAHCGVNIVDELNAEGHIDHIIPLAEGGSNDLVNLQLLCSTCNLRKATSIAIVRSSVPTYIQRRKAAKPCGQPDLERYASSKDGWK